jgi:hypothetical protein
MRTDLEKTFDQIATSFLTALETSSLYAGHLLEGARNRLSLEKSKLLQLLK